MQNKSYKEAEKTTIHLSAGTGANYDFNESGLFLNKLNMPQKHLNASRRVSISQPTKTKRVFVTLPTDHVDKNSTRWRQAPRISNVQYRLPMTNSYAFAAEQLLRNISRPCKQPSPNMLLSTVDINLQNIKKWAILDSGASSHFLVTGAPVTNKKVATNPIAVTLPDGD